MRKPAFKMFLFLVTVSFTGALNAAGLGRLTVNSTLGQPFRAEIDVVAVKMEERSSLDARLASRDTFRLAHVDYSPSLSTFKTSVETRADGQPYIKVVSAQPVVEPLLNMLIELNWSSGRLLREYAVLLPTAEADAHDASAARSSSDKPPVPGGVSGPAPTEKMERFSGKQLPETAEEKRVQKGAVNSTLSTTKGNMVYGPVKQGDTLGGIVRSIALPSGISFNQMLIALQRANSNAFLGNNIHQLKAGPILRIPDASEIKAIPRLEADKEVNTQTMEWSRGRSPDATRTPTGELKQTVSGKIAAADPDPGEAEPPHQVLRLSRGEELPGNGGNKNGTAYHAAAPLAKLMAEGQGNLRMAEEEAIARTNSLLESNERIALLEKNISELQRLLELRRLALAELRKQPHGLAKSVSDAGEGFSTPAVVSAGEGASHFAAAAQPPFSSSTLISIAGASVAEGAAVPDRNSSLVEIAGSVQASTLPRNKPEVAYPYPERSRNWIEDLTRNIEYLGGALVLLIMGMAGVSMSRRPRKMPFAGHDTGKAVDPSEFVVEDKAAAAVRDRKELVEQAPMARDPMAKKAPDDLGAGSRKADGEQYAADGVAESNPSHSPYTARSLPLSPGLAASASSIVSVHPAVKEVHLSKFEAHHSGASAWYRQGKDTPWHEIVNKIDLARAYQEMGDRDAAGQVLQEVMREGDIQQQARAKALLSNL